MKMEKPKKVFLVIQSVLTIIGAISSVLMLRRIIVDKVDLLSILNTVFFLGVFVYIMVYGLHLYKKGDKFFIHALNAYASLLGLGLVYSSYFVHEMGLSQGKVLLIIIFNLIAFGNTTKAGALLDNKKECVFYLAFANGAKFAVELYQIFISLPNADVLQILTSLSVPVLGTTVLIAYFNRYAD